MIKQVYVIYDKVAGAVATTLMMTDKEEVLLRDLRGSTKLLPTMESNPEDFEICHIGSFDLDNCILDAFPEKKVVMTIKELKDGKTV